MTANIIEIMLKGQEEWNKEQKMLEQIMLQKLKDERENRQKAEESEEEKVKIASRMTKQLKKW